MTSQQSASKKTLLNQGAFKQILRKYVKIIDNFSFDKGATVVANKKDHFIYF